MIRSSVALALLCAAAVSAGSMSSMSVFKETGTGPSPLHARLMSSHSLSSRNTTMPAGGDVWPVGIYWVELQIGTPAKSYPVAIDTGSGDLYIEGLCDGSCPTTAPNRQYDPSSSSSSTPVLPFVFSATYETCDLSHITAPCTIKGKVYKDKVTAGGLGPVDVTLGAITSMTSNFDQFKNICGVMGLIGSSAGNVFSQLVGATDVNNVFSLCISTDPSSKSNATLTLGGVDSRLHSGPVQYVPDSGGEQGFYGVDANSVTIGDKSISGTAPSWILDSGTNILLLPDEGVDSLQSALTSMCSTTKLAGLCDQPSGSTIFDEKCFPLTAAEVAAYPPLSFHLKNDVTLTMSPHDYLIHGDVRAGGDDTLVCLGVRRTGRGGLQIIGDTLMRNYLMVMDREKQAIGWAPVNAANCGNV